MDDTGNKLIAVDSIKRELKKSSISRPNWALIHRSLRPANEIASQDIPKSFLDAVLEIIAKTIEKVLAEVLARSVAEGIEKKMHPLRHELALSRIAIEHDWDSSGQRREGKAAGEEFHTD
jgi:hypothetical protein